MLEKIIEYIKQKYNPLSIILYGSYANGTNNLNSDFDALVLQHHLPLYIHHHLVVTPSSCEAWHGIVSYPREFHRYRPCDNPRCGKYFLVRTTSTKVRYCSTECCNRVTQGRYRKRKREKEEN